MKKRALCLFLALALCLSLLPASAFAANGSKAIMLGSDILSEGGVNTSGAATVYFGKDEEDKVAEWRVIGHRR